jgi:hypothetical protein
VLRFSVDALTLFAHVLLVVSSSVLLNLPAQAAQQERIALKDREMAAARAELAQVGKEISEKRRAAGDADQSVRGESVSRPPGLTRSDPLR